MRTLMLHGHATSAMIFKAQTVPFRSKLDKTFEFDFVDGPYPCAPPRGLSTVVSKAYTWFKSPDVKSIRNTVAWLTRYIEKNGPYDCICCFSRAAGVVMAMLMYAAREGTDESRARIMPRALVFINGYLEYSFLEDLGMSITEEARRTKFKTEELVKSKGDALSMLSVATVRGTTNGLWDDTRKLMHDPTKIPPPSNCFGLDLTSLPEDVKIHLPTIHLVGGKDPIWPSSVQLSYLCDPDSRTFYDHQGGHDLPRTPKVSADIAGMFNELARTLQI